MIKDRGSNWERFSKFVRTLRKNLANAKDWKSFNARLERGRITIEKTL
jgi:hypothetical protein